MTGERDADGCALCGLPVGERAVADESERAFCCVGCRNVHERLADVDGVTDDDVATTAADGTRAGVPDGCERVYFRVDGMHCATCESFVESLATRLDGVESAAASYVTESVRVDYDPDAVDAEEVRAALTTAGYTARRRTDATPGEDDEETKWRLAAGVLFGMWVMMPYAIFVYPLHLGLYGPSLAAFTRQQLAGPHHLAFVLFLFTSLVLFYTGAPLLRGALVSLRTGEPNMDLLVALAACSAFVYSIVAALLGRIDLYFDVTVAIVLVVTAGGYYESRIRRRAADRLADVHAARTDTARRLDAAGEPTEVAVEDLAEGDRVLVRAGERVPVDGTVGEGTGTVDEAVVTGEALPVPKSDGDGVVGGSVVTDGALVVAVGEGATSGVDRVAELMWDLQSGTEGVQRLADRLATVFVPGVLALAVAAGVGYLLLGAGVEAAVLVALTVLLVSCPCALGLATPLAVASAVREALSRGIVVFDRTVFERVRDVDTVVLDKTGTLTTGDLRVEETAAPSPLLRAAAAVEARASHPVGDAFVAAFGEGAAAGDPRADGGAVVDDTADGSDAGDSDGATVESFRRHQRGVEGVVDGERTLVGHPDCFGRRGWSVPAEWARRATDVRERGLLPVLVGREGTAEGIVALADEPREGWRSALTDLGERGVDVVVLTGDDERAAARFGDHAAVEQVFAGVPPEAKAETVERLRADGTVAMVGDGTNDGPALAAADLGVALGSGTALAVDAADVAIVDDDLASLGTVFDLSTAAARRIKGNVGWAFVYNATALPLAVAGLLNPLFAAAAMAASSLLVVVNSDRDLLDD
ncbi:heavy metal translocating P-type ATPase [Haloarcula litorea]|uniref:heavy metal translocating P-type ATPase n=1 Tax=Haloarcula litorea TaxID=3032579 RepID=UPI0023E82BC9|nr:cation-translocating P-type ATPase [Halomicroarcula sp. GDY20]